MSPDSRYFVARCTDCEADLPFDTHEQRDAWAALHREGQGHDVRLGRATTDRANDFTEDPA